MRGRELVGTVAVESGEIAIVDPSHILEMEDFLKVSTKIGDGIFPVYFEEDDSLVSKSQSDLQGNEWRNPRTVKSIIRRQSNL